MKAVILAGGYGTRISEESHLKPKPMIEIGEKPILWHIIKEYSHYGINEFVICCGYKQHIIKEYFNDYYLHNSDITFDFTDGNKMTVLIMWQNMESNLGGYRSGYDDGRPCETCSEIYRR